jgi:hypothetical protein
MQLWLGGGSEPSIKKLVERARESLHPAAEISLAQYLIGLACRTGSCTVRLR